MKRFFLFTLEHLYVLLCGFGVSILASQAQGRGFETRQRGMIFLVWQEYAQYAFRRMGSKAVVPCTSVVLHDKEPSVVDWGRPGVAATLAKFPVTPGGAK